MNNKRRLLKFLTNIENNFYAIKFKWFYRFGLIPLTSDLESIVTNREITFFEDFNNNTLDSNKWNTCFPWGRRIVTDGINSFLSYGENIIINNSVANFYVAKKTGLIYDWEGAYNYTYTVGHINSFSKFSQKYGRWEAKIKVSKNKRCWPAFWLLSNTHTFDENGITKENILPEIDIFEHFGGENNYYKNMQFTYHCGLGYDHPTKVQYPTHISNIDFSSNYFIYALEIKKNKIIWYINNEIVKIHRYLNHEEYEIANHPMYIILNEAINGKYVHIYNDELPDGMKVDWVKVYK